MDDLAAEGRFGPVVADPASNSDGLHSDSSASGEATEAKLEYLKAIHRRKTGALIVASLELGGLAAEASAEQLDTLRQYGQEIGLAFQIVDDCLDVESTPEQMGKQTRKDSELGKLTYPGLLGLQESKQLAEELISKAIQRVSSLGERTQGLVELAEYVIRRNR
jgi:geranylgeranyl diphosphate synthase type II